LEPRVAAFQVRYYFACVSKPVSLDPLDDGGNILVTAFTLDQQLKVIALAGATAAFLVGLLQYTKSQRWKRAEWVSQEMDTFFRDPTVRAALQMIDWGTRRVELYPHRENYDDRFVLITDDIVAAALSSHHDRPRGFTLDETQIRDTFDHFLDRLGRLHSFVEAGLVTTADVAPYLRYWAAQILAAQPGDPRVDRLMQLRRFIVQYGYLAVQELLESVIRARRGGHFHRERSRPVT
jgi:hypothetical protein